MGGAGSRPSATTVRSMSVCMTTSVPRTHRRSLLRAGLGLCLWRGVGGPAATTLSHEASQRRGVTRRLRFEISVQNTGSSILPSQSLWAYAPVRTTGYQDLLEVHSNLAVSQHVDAIGQSVLHWRLPDMSPHAARLISLDVVVRLYAQPRPETVVDGEWLKPERYVESDDAALQALAHRLKQRNPMDTLQSVYDHVRSTLRYSGYVADDWGALRALTEGQGDCTEYAYLVVALCRAAGLPARAMGGFVAHQDAAPRAAEYHNWAEVYVDGVWRLVDAQREVFQVEAEAYVAFRRITDQVHSRMGLAHRFVTDGPAHIHFR